MESGITDKLRKCLPEEVFEELTRVRGCENPVDKLKNLKRFLTIYETHTDRMVPPALILGSHVGLQKEQLEYLEQASVLHDIGKIAVPTLILEADRELDKEEMAVIREHPITGELIVKYLGLANEVSQGVKHHHQKYDGTGYPSPRLRGKNIPLIARIISIIDAFDAITSDRPYQDRIPFKAACQILSENSGTQFDPDLIRLFERLEQPILEFEKVVRHSKERTASPEQLMHTYIELCKFYLSFGYIEMALGSLEEAKKHIEISDSVGSVRFRRLLGRTIFYRQGRNAVRDSIEHIEKSIEIAHKIEDQIGIGKGFLELLNISIAIGEKTVASFLKSPFLLLAPTAERFFQDGLAAATDKDDFFTAAQLINQMIYLLTMRDKPSEALFLMNGQQKLIKKISRFTELNIQFYNHIGIAYQAVNNFDEAIRYYDKAIEMARERVANRELQWVLNGKGYTLLRMKKFDDALLHFNEALLISRELMDYRETALTLMNIGEVYLKKKSYEKAYEKLSEAYNLKKERYPNMENAPEGIHGSLMLELLLLKSQYHTGKKDGTAPLDELIDRYSTELNQAPYLVSTITDMIDELGLEYSLDKKLKNIHAVAK